jgi:signal transduction histidine kinase/DNA-binding response OmpR family regulator
MRAHILLIDDSESAQEAISEILHQQDYTVATASNGAEGLSYVEQHHCDLILLDNSLPDTNGLALLQKIVKNHTDVPVIMVTGSGSEGLAVSALKNGASDYLTKSDDFLSKLSHSVRDNLEKFEMKRRNWELENQLRNSYKRQKELNRELEEKVQQRTEELERAYQLSNELMAKAVDSNMQLAELYTEVDEARRRLDAKIRELFLLNEVGKAIASTPERDRLLQLSLQSVSEELGIEHCAILLINEDTQHLQIGVSYGTPDDLLLAAKSLEGDRILWDAIKKDSPLLIQDVEFDEQLSPLAEEYPGLECFMLAPMRMKSRDIGIFTVYGFEHNATFTQDDLDFVVSLASQASITLSNIRLTTQQLFRERMKQLDKLAEFFHSQLGPPLRIFGRVAEQLGEQQLDPESAALLSRPLFDGVARVKQLFDDFRKLSQHEKSILTRQDVTVTQFFEEIFSEFETELDAQQIQLHRNWEYEGNFSIDRDKMIHVCCHLVDYARHAMPNGGNWTVASRCEGETLHLEFIDDGYGMSPETQARFFRPFAGDEDSYDSGLGMSLVKKIVEEHHARIDVQSALEKGTTIHIAFPLS